jgi:hypothetical protein
MHSNITSILAHDRELLTSLLNSSMQQTPPSASTSAPASKVHSPESCTINNDIKQDGKNNAMHLNCGDGKPGAGSANASGDDRARD